MGHGYEMLMQSGGSTFGRDARGSDLTDGIWGVKFETAALLTRSTSCHVASQVLIAFDRGKAEGRESGRRAGEQEEKKTWSE